MNDESAQGPDHMLAAGYFSWRAPAWKRVLGTLLVLVAWSGFACGGCTVLTAGMIGHPLGSQSGALVALAVTLGLWGVGTFLRRSYARAQPDAAIEAYLDRLLAWRIEALKARGIERLGLHVASDSSRPDDRALAAPPHVLRVGIWPTDTDGSPAATFVRQGRDGVYRFSRHELTVFCLAEHHLGRFRCVFDLASESCITEETGDYHYKDVVSLETSQEQVTRPEGSQLVRRHFEMRFSDGRKVRVPFEIADPMTTTDDNRAWDAITALRKLLADKRGMYVQLRHGP